MANPWNEVPRQRGRPERRRKLLPAWLATAGTFTGGALLIGALVAALTGLSAGSGAAVPASPQEGTEVAALRRELDDVRGRLALAEVSMQRMTAVTKYSSLYHVPADLAAAIYDIALAEGIHPSLGFQLVKVESGFKSGARSNQGAIGYTQIQLRTARAYDAKLTERSLQDRDTNLRLGFRFLKDLLGQFDEDLHMALVAYNRGPGRVFDLMTRGEDPANGYAETVMKGVKKGS
jgi:soluble lytic murein transglycosylase-like protein